MDNKKPSVCMMNIVLDGDYQYEQEIPLGMAYVGAYLRKCGYETKFHQCFASRPENLDLAVKVNCDVYGIQLNMVNYHKSCEFAEKLKAENPNAVIVLGGPFLASLYEDIMTKQPLFDFIILGEGEITFRELLEALQEGGSFNRIDGLVWRDKGGNIVKNNLRELIEDLDSLPFPSRDLLETAKRDPIDNGLLESIRLVTSRGCIGNCSFCCVNLYNKMTHGKIWRGHSPKHVVDEIEQLSQKYGAKLFNFSDSSFEDPGEMGKKRAREICEEIIKRQIPFSAKVYMRCETMKTDDDIELLKLYKKAGIDVIIIGVESGSEYELKLYEKHANLEDNYRTAKILKDLDMFFVMTGFIMFGPNSTLDSIKENIDFLYKSSFAENIMAVSNGLLLIRGSKLYEMLKNEGRVYENDNYWEFPKYSFIDNKSERVSSYWQTILKRQPLAYEINKLQVNMGNVVSRMKNPMNEKILSAFSNEYESFQKTSKELFLHLGEAHYRHFTKILEMIDGNFSSASLDKAEDEFFKGEYQKLYTMFDQVYNNFMDTVQSKGFGMSGLVFRHFINANAINTETAPL